MPLLSQGKQLSLWQCHERGNSYLSGGAMKGWYSYLSGGAMKGWYSYLSGSAMKGSSGLAQWYQGKGGTVELLNMAKNQI